MRLFKERHSLTRSWSCDYNDDIYFEDRCPGKVYDGDEHEYPYHKSRPYIYPQRYRTHYYDGDGPPHPESPPYYLYNYRTMDELFNSHFFKEERVLTKLYTDEYTRPVGWFYGHLISSTERRVAAATTARLWSGLRRRIVLDSREQRTRERDM